VNRGLLGRDRSVAVLLLITGWCASRRLAERFGVLVGCLISIAVRVGLVEQVVDEVMRHRGVTDIPAVTWCR